MKSRTSAAIVLCLAGLLLSLSVTASAETRQNKTQKKLVIAAEPVAEKVQNEMQNAMPGAPHSALAKLAGEYTTATKFFIEPGTPAQDSTGEAKLWMTLDGRFLSEDNSGMLMGQPTKGFKMVGYNNASKRYEGIWVYTQSTSIMTLNGTSSDGGKTINFAGSFDADQSGIRLDVVVRHTDNDHFVVELSSKTPDGKPGPRLVTTYTRKK